MHGLLLIDKPRGLTSHDVVRRVRRVYQTRKVGHAGTLDPLATGVLPVAIGEGTKLLQFLLAEDKAYLATLKLGVTTDTLDAEGSICLERAIPADAAERLPQIARTFVGDIEQIPPMYSALKRNGVPLYKLARAGQEVERQPRRVHIARLDLKPARLPEVTFEVECSKGTYVRSLCAEIGEILGCGAHMTALRRLRTGRYAVDQCLPLDELESPLGAIERGAFLGIDEALFYYPAVAPTDEAISRLKNGVPPAASDLAEVSHELVPGGLVRIVDKGRLLAMARYAPERQKEHRGDFELIRVFNRPQAD